MKSSKIFDMSIGRSSNFINSINKTNNIDYNNS